MSLISGFYKKKLRYRQTINRSAFQVQTNRVPFVWSSDYEVAIVYITSMWLEMDNTGEPPVAWGLIAKDGFLSYCVRFKNRLATFDNSVSTTQCIHLVQPLRVSVEFLPSKF